MYRITKLRYRDPLDPGGAQLFGGRFNLPAEPAIHCAQTESLARLESLADVIQSRQFTRVLHSIEVPDREVEDPVRYEVALPADWDKITATDGSRRYGSTWLHARHALALWVPSVESRTEHHLLINPGHPHFRQIKVRERHPIVFDPRFGGLQ